MRVFTTGDPRVPLVFNVDGHVGQGAPNANHDDVLLVQFLLRKNGEVVPEMTPSQKARLAKVPTSGFCDGSTIDGIKAYQEFKRSQIPGTIVDGCISPARGAVYGSSGWTIVFLNNGLRLTFPQKWPRLQDVDGCPPALKPRLDQALGIPGA